ncbi:uncharacterized [Tachysurus ichikawai]
MAGLRHSAGLNGPLKSHGWLRGSQCNASGAQQEVELHRVRGRNWTYCKASVKVQDQIVEQSASQEKSTPGVLSIWTIIEEFFLLEAPAPGLRLRVCVRRDLKHNSCTTTKVKVKRNLQRNSREDSVRGSAPRLIRS